MNFAKLSTNVAILTIACSTATLSNAEIKKCLENDGSVSYSDRACDNALAVEKLGVEDTTPAGIASLQAYEAQRAAQRQASESQLVLSGEAVEQTTPVVQTPWAQLLVKKIRYSTDVETVSQARQTLASLDRQQIATQPQKLPLYR